MVELKEKSESDIYQDFLSELVNSSMGAERAAARDAIAFVNNLGSEKLKQAAMVSVATLLGYETAINYVRAAIQSQWPKHKECVLREYKKTLPVVSPVLTKPI